MNQDSQKDQSNNKTSRVIKSILIGIFAIVVVTLIQDFSDIDFIEIFRPGTKIERVREKMKTELKEEYGEEFVVYNIGLRSARGDKFYQARIYPKSIKGTKRENDRYYYREASVEVSDLGFIEEGVANTYGEVLMNEKCEEYLKPKVEEIFGKKIRLKPQVEYKRKENGTFIRYYARDFKEKLKEIENMPKKRRIELTLYLYIFDRIDNKQEKEKRRKDIFEFVQYLKEEKLFEYLEMGVIFIDGRVLAPSYEEYEEKRHDREWITKEMDGETIELPPDSFRTEMSKQLQSEIDTMNEEELIDNMKEIRKSELEYDDIEKYNASHYVMIYSTGILKIKYKSSYEKYNEKGKLKQYYYKNISDIKIGRNLEYMFK